MKVTYISEDDVFSGDYDSNNHEFNYEGERITSERYFQILEKTSMEKWIDKIYSDYQIYDLNPFEIKILIEASHIGMFTQKVSNLYIEELSVIAKNIDEKIKFDQRYFIRLSSSSPKDSEFFESHIENGWGVVRQLVTSQRINKALCRGVSRIYFVPFRDEISNNNELEFRVFVYKGKITAISQYQYHVDKKLYELNNLERILPIAQRLNQDFTYLDDYVIDMWIDFSNDNGLVIEVNSFGMEMAAGSCLFHWIRDREQLYGKNDVVELRLTKKMPF